LAICLNSDQKQIIGLCVFHGWNLLSDDNDQIGYFIDPEHQGYGYTVEAIGCLLKFYFAQYPERHVYATARPANHASQKVLEKLGFKKFGTKNINVHGIDEPRAIYSVDISNLKTSDS